MQLVEGAPHRGLGERYRLIEKIGSGGAATVFLADDVILERQVAIKRLHSDGPDDAARRFRREARISAGLSHVNLVAVFDAFSDHDDLVVVMEYVPGRDLAQVLADGPPERQHAFQILDGLAAAIDHLHAAGVIHRDVKPSNVLLGPGENTVKLTDLGIAKVLEDTATTQANAVPGSLPYMSPDQLTGASVGKPSDIYSYALVAYEVLSGRKAHRGGPAEIGHKTLNEPPPDIREVVPETPPAVAELLLRCLSREPTERPASAREVAAGLREAFTDADAPVVRAAPAPPPEPRRTSGHARRAPVAGAPGAGGSPLVRWAGGAALLLALVAIALVVLLGGGSGSSGPGDEAPDPADIQASNDRGGGDDASAAAAGAGDPAAEALEGFYSAAAADDFTTASELASPNLIEQLGGEAGIESTFATLETVQFDELRTVSEDAGQAEVAFETTAVHTDRTETCSGSATLIETGGTWLVDSLVGVECS